jgi:RimJ/RimL family protein N-acetyltransferase
LNEFFVYLLVFYVTNLCICYPIQLFHFNFFATTGKTIGEVEIMIAEKSARGQKLGWESMALMLRYGLQVLKIDEFEAKIKSDNHSSIAMFEKLQFVESGKPDQFIKESGKICVNQTL